MSVAAIHADRGSETRPLEVVDGGGTPGRRTHNAGWPASSRLVPLPAGEVVQTAVRADFIEVNRAFVILGRQEFTGYMRLASEDTHAAAMLLAGSVVAAMFEWAGAITNGTQAFSSMRATVDSGRGVVDIVRLPDEVFVATHQLLAGPPVYEGLRGSFVRPAEFVEHLCDSGLVGGLRVHGRGGHGVVLFNRGLVGAYTARSTRPTSSLGGVLDIFHDPACEVTVTGSSSGQALPLVIL